MVDAYEELIKAEREEKITIIRYDEFIGNKKREEWLKKVIVEDYKNSELHPEYRFFLKKKFSKILG